MSKTRNFQTNKNSENRFKEKVKRTTTEILIEIEETVAVRRTEKSFKTETKSDRLKGENNTCQFCGQPISIIEKLQQEKNEDGNE